MKQKLSWLIGFAFLLSLAFGFSSNASAAELLTKEEKTQYYQEYLKIADEVRAENPNAIPFTVDEFENIKEKDWVEPEQYRENLNSIIDGEIEFVVKNSPLTTYSAGPTPAKYVYAYSNGTLLGQIVVSATVSTVWDSGVQVISNITNVSSYTMQGGSSWSQTGANPSKVTSQKWNLQLIGNFFVGATKFPQAFTIEYKCDSYGTIS